MKKIRTEYFIKIPILAIYLLPFIVSYFRDERVTFSKIYYVGLIVTFLGLFKFKDEVLNNWIFALTIILFLISLFMIIPYFTT